MEQIWLDSIDWVEESLANLSYVWAMEKEMIGSFWCWVAEDAIKDFSHVSIFEHIWGEEAVIESDPWYKFDFERTKAWFCDY